MAVNTSRSMLGELDEGRSDGVIRKRDRNRAGEVDPATSMVRTNLHDDYGYGTFVEGTHYTGEEYLPR